MLSEPNPVTGLCYAVLRIRTTFSRAGHVVVFFRRMADGKDYLNDIETFYGRDGRLTRAEAMRCAKAWVKPHAERPRYRNIHPTSEVYTACRRVGLSLSLVEH